MPVGEFIGEFFRNKMFAHISKGGGTRQVIWNKHREMGKFIAFGLSDIK